MGQVEILGEMGRRVGSLQIDRVVLDDLELECWIARDPLVATARSNPGVAYPVILPVLL